MAKKDDKKAKSEAKKQEAVSSALQQIEKKFGQGSIMKMGTNNRADVKRFSSGVRSFSFSE